LALSQRKFAHEYESVGFEVLTAVVMKSTILWHITPCSPLSVNRFFGRIYRLHVQGRKNKLSKKPVWKQERWKRYIPPKRRLTLNGLHGVISQKKVFWIRVYYLRHACPSVHRYLIRELMIVCHEIVCTGKFHQAVSTDSKYSYSQKQATATGTSRVSADISSVTH
jgi:hypothetical protein